MNEQQICNIIKTKLLEDFQKNNRKGLYAATQKIMAYNSNKIEGSTLTSEQTASLFDTGTIVSNGIEVYKAKDIEEMNGHFKMFNQMVKSMDKPLSIELIKSFHYQLKSGVFEDIANGYAIGDFKKRTNSVSDLTTTNPSQVAEELEALLNEYESSNKDLEAIASFHAKYEHIHPFQDGNGRTGRMIMFKQCLDNGLIPVIIRDEEKLLYYKALHSAQVDNDFSALIEFCQKSQQFYLEYINDFIQDYSVPTVDFNSAQKEQIALGLDNGLTSVLISNYAKPEYTAKEMSEIRTNMISNIKDVITDDLKESKLVDISESDIELRKDGIYFCGEKLTTIDELLEAHPELQPAEQGHILEQDDTENHDWDE